MDVASRYSPLRSLQLELLLHGQERYSFYVGFAFGGEGPVNGMNTCMYVYMYVRTRYMVPNA